MSAVDVAIIGAGPAGLAAAALCAECGLSATLYDEQSGVGGQIYRGIGASPHTRAEILGDDYWHGASLVAPFKRSGARYVPNTTVWAIARRAEHGFTLSLTTGPAHARQASAIDARAVILATGAMERPFPIPGWTLPGVMTAGAAQILLKTAGLAPHGRTVLAGCGPLLWLVAAQLVRAGTQIDAVLDTTPRGRLAQALRAEPAFVVSPYFAKGRELVREVRRATRVVEYVTSLAIEGLRTAAAVRYASDGRENVLLADLVLLHQGVVPDTSLAGAAGCALAWNDAQACFAPVTDAWGGTSVPGLYVAGDGAGIAGAIAAEARGRIVALAVANALGRITGDARAQRASAPRAMLAKALRGRAFLDVLYRPADAFRIPAGGTLACRCEEVAAETIARLALEGCAGPNQMKAYTRCGMGPCQGRLCGLTVTEIIARAQRRDPEDVGCLHARFPAKPVALGDLAAMPASEAAQRAVARSTNHRS